MRTNRNITYEIKKHIGVISEKGNGWKKELNVVVWNEGEPKWDIREWNEDHTRMGKGMTLNDEEAKALCELFGKTFS